MEFAYLILLDREQIDFIGLTYVLDRKYNGIAWMVIRIFKVLYYQRYGRVFSGQFYMRPMRSTKHSPDGWLNVCIIIIIIHVSGELLLYASMRTRVSSYTTCTKTAVVLLGTILGLT